VSLEEGKLCHSFRSGGGASKGVSHHMYVVVYIWYKYISRLHDACMMTTMTFTLRFCPWCSSLHEK
jgi:hypothetical protein